jgi:hypothetical protein
MGVINGEEFVPKKLAILKIKMKNKIDMPSDESLKKIS